MYNQVRKCMTNIGCGTRGVAIARKVFILLCYINVVASLLVRFVAATAVRSLNVTVRFCSVSHSSTSKNCKYTFNVRKG